MYTFFMNRLTHLSLISSSSLPLDFYGTLCKGVFDFTLYYSIEYKHNASLNNKYTRSQQSVVKSLYGRNIKLTWRRLYGDHNFHDTQI